VLLILFLFLLKIFLVILDVIENIWRPFLDQNEYKNIILHYENIKLKKEVDNLQNYLKDNKPSYNNNFVLGVVIGFWIGWFLFDGGSDG